MTKKKVSKTLNSLTYNSPTAPEISLPTLASSYYSSLPKSMATFCTNFTLLFFFFNTTPPKAKPLSFLAPWPSSSSPTASSAGGRWSEKGLDLGGRWVTVRFLSQAAALRSKGRRSDIFKKKRMC